MPSRLCQPQASAVSAIKYILAFMCTVFSIGSLYAMPLSKVHKSTNTIFGNWMINTPEKMTFLQMNHNNSYFHIELNLLKPQNSVAEWGRISARSSKTRLIPSYSSNQQQGLAAYHINHPRLQMSLTLASAKLVFTIDTHADNVADEQYQYDPYVNQSVYGLWHQISTSALSSLILLDNGYYAVVQINIYRDPQVNPHVTHLQWGRFDIQQNQLFTYPIFDNHSQQNVIHRNTIPSIFYHQNRQQLALSFDSNKDNLSDHLQLFTR